MGSIEFDNVKAEKEDVLCRYNMEKKLQSGLRFIGFLSVLFLTSWSSFPTLIPDTVGVAGDILRRFINHLHEPLSIFIAINIIILVVYVLSSQKQSTSSDIYDEYVSSSRRIVPAVSTITKETKVEKQIVPVETVVADVTEQQLIKPAAMSTLCHHEVKQKEYMRTRSLVASESRNRRPRSRKFRRSDTAMMGRELVVSSTEQPRKSIHEMSNEEFQSIVDSFIAEKRKTLMQENYIAQHYSMGKQNCMSIVVKN